MATAETNAEKLENEFEKLEKARSFKQAGNEHFKINDHKGAVRNYHRALLFTRGLGISLKMSADFTSFLNPDGVQMSYKQPEEIKNEAAKISVDCHNNIAACLLLKDDPNYEKIIEHCDEAINLAPSTKSLYRKGVALYNLRDIDEAFTILKMAYDRPDGKKDPNIRKYIALCEKDMKMQDERLKNTYKGMFGKMDAS